jgi:hypothetical protein
MTNQTADGCGASRCRFQTRLPVGAPHTMPILPGLPTSPHLAEFRQHQRLRRITPRRDPHQPVGQLARRHSLGKLSARHSEVSSPLAEGRVMHGPNAQIGKSLFFSLSALLLSTVTVN